MANSLDEENGQPLLIGQCEEKKVKMVLGLNISSAFLHRMRMYH
jgi:hypothetical protein